MMALALQGEVWVRGAGFKDQTVVHPLGLVALLVFGLVLFLAPRRYALVPVLCLITLVSIAQRVSIAGLDFSFVRLLVLAGLARVFSRGEHRSIRRNRLDIAVAFWTVSGIVIHTLGEGTPGAFIFKTGRALEFTGMYFLARVLVRSWADVATLTRAVAVLSIPVALAFFVEKSTGRNPFSFLGGVNPITAMREGRLRCQGAFAHPIIAGTFWAMTLPWLVLAWMEGRSRLLIGAGIGASLFIIYASSSSTPVMAVLLGFVGAGFFPLRRHMRTIRLAGFATLVGLHMVMKAPVWSLVGRIDVVGGSTGYHRFRLIDQAIYRFDEWALFGTPSTNHWGWGLHDVTNTYILVGIGGGFLTMLFFMWILVVGFGTTGRMVRRAAGKRELYRAWTVGVLFFVHAVVMIVLGYFGQMDTLWYLQLGVASALGDAALRGRAKRSAGPRKRRSTRPLNPLATRPKPRLGIGGGPGLSGEVSLPGATR